MRVSLPDPPRCARADGRHRCGAGSVIIGIGSDLCNIERIQNRSTASASASSTASSPTSSAPRRSAAVHRAGTYAKRFAAKEAFSKAVGTGFKRGVFMKDIGVVNQSSGEPTLR
jgi:holo-[acyl-carrier protein] synthase